MCTIFFALSWFLRGQTESVLNFLNWNMFVCDPQFQGYQKAQSVLKVFCEGVFFLQRNETKFLKVVLNQNLCKYKRVPHQNMGGLLPHVVNLIV